MDPRTKISAALVVAAAVANGAESIGTRLLLPPKPEGTLQALQQVAAHRPTYAALVTVGTLAVPLMAAAFWIMTAVARERSPHLGTAARALLMAGMWGFLGMHVVLLTQVPLSSIDTQQAGAAALEAVQGSALMGVLFLLPFLVGCTLGLLMLAAALVRSAVPRWVPLAMLAFLVVDFGLQNGGPIDGHWLWIAASLGIAHFLLRPASPASGDVASSRRVVVEA